MTALQKLLVFLSREQRSAAGCSGLRSSAPWQAARARSLAKRKRGRCRGPHRPSSESRHLFWDRCKGRGPGGGWQRCPCVMRGVHRITVGLLYFSFYTVSDLSLGLFARIDMFSSDLV